MSYPARAAGLGKYDTAIWMDYLDTNQTAGEKARRQLHKNAASNFEQVLEAIPHKACLPSRKLSKLDEPDVQDTAREAGTSSWVMYSYGPPHMAVQKQDDQLEHTFSSSVRRRNVALKTCQRRWTMGRSGERRSGIFVLLLLLMMIYTRYYSLRWFFKKVKKHFYWFFSVNMNCIRWNGFIEKYFNVAKIFILCLFKIGKIKKSSLALKRGLLLDFDWMISVTMQDLQMNM